MIEHGTRLSWLRQLALGAGVFTLSVTAALGQAPNAHPTGGTVVAGQASISFDNGVVTITSTTPQAVINWQSFNIGSQQQVVITGPSANATVLNRVVGPNPFQIAGQLKSNGLVFLVNGSGGRYQKGAQVDVVGLLSTSTDIANQDFMSGNLAFAVAGNANALMENQGEIKVSDGGMLGLIAPGVSNSGRLVAPSGSIALISTSTFNLGGPDLWNVMLPLSSTVRSDLVVNTGTIRARAGAVLLEGYVAPNVSGSIRVGGEVRTKSVGAKTGTVAVIGSGAGVVVVGTIDATGAQAGTTGGSVQVVGSTSTELAAPSVVDVSGDVGGGVAAIGVTLARAKGGPGTASTLTSNTVLIDQGAQISADALVAGNGGRVAALSLAQTNFAGTITARGLGASPGGFGGFVEVSGGTGLSFTGQVDVTGPSGQGTLLLDPFDFIITKPIADALSAQLVAGRSGKLILQADHDIEVDAAIDGRGGVPGTQLIFDAGNQIRLNADVFTNNAPIEVNVGAGGVLASRGPLFVPALSR
jgi:filamentous hemagglutinin family protein